MVSFAIARVPVYTGRVPVYTNPFAVPCRRGIGRKHNKIVGKVLHKLRSNRSMAEKKDLKKLD